MQCWVCTKWAWPQHGKQEIQTNQLLIAAVCLRYKERRRLRPAQEPPHLPPTATILLGLLFDDLASFLLKLASSPHGFRFNRKPTGFITWIWPAMDTRKMPECYVTKRKHLRISTHMTAPVVCTYAFAFEEGAAA